MKGESVRNEQFGDWGTKGEKTDSLYYLLRARLNKAKFLHRSFLPRRLVLRLLFDPMDMMMHA